MVLPASSEWFGMRLDAYFVRLDHRSASGNALQKEMNDLKTEASQALTPIFDDYVNPLTVAALVVPLLRP